MINVPHISEQHTTQFTSAAQFIMMNHVSNVNADIPITIAHCAVLLALFASYETFAAEDAAKHIDDIKTNSRLVASANDSAMNRDLQNYINSTSSYTSTMTLPQISLPGKDPVPGKDPLPGNDNMDFVLRHMQQPLPRSLWDDVKDLFNDFESDVVAIDFLYCGPTCRFKTGLKRSRKKGQCDDCSCSENCQQSGDCCPDLVLLYNQTHQREKYPGCIGDEIPLTKDTKSYLIINWCPKYYNVTHLKMACEEPPYTDWSSVVPHFNIDSGTSFRNSYCAQCHGQNNTRSWSTSISCSSFDNALHEADSLLVLFNATVKSKVCSIHFAPPSLDTQTCKARQGAVIDSCNVTGKWRFYDKNIAKACSMFSHVVNGTYRNVFCYLCNTDLDWHSILRQTVSDKSKQVMTATLTALIDFSNTLESQHRGYSQDEITPNLNSSKWLVAYLKQCSNLSVTCAEGKHLDKDQCRSVFSSSNMYGYRVCFQINISITNQLTSTRDLHMLFFNHYPGINRRVIQLTNITSYVLQMQNCPDKTMYVVVRYMMSFFSMSYLKRDQFERELMGDTIIKTNSSVYIRYQEGCNTESVSALKKGDEHHCSMQFHTFVLNERYPTGDYDVKIQKGAKYLQLNKQLGCPRVILNASHYSINYHNSTSNTNTNKVFTFPVLVLLKTRAILKDEDFQELDNRTVIVCLDDYMNATLQMTVPCINERLVTQTTILGVLSFVCTSVSLLFLAITFLTYCLFPSMRTIGGVCNMALVATMFAAQSFYEFGVEQNEDVIGCQIIGMLIHFLWLAAVFWMNACTFLLFLKLSFPLKCRNFGHNLIQIFSFSALYVNGSSAVIVCLNIILNIAFLGVTGYGGNICYLNTMFSTIYLFKVPMGILIIINICLFTFTICRIRHHDSVTSTRESKINLFSCIKLSVITGLVWLSSYLYEIFHITAFAYIFTILVGSQGIFFFFAIVMNRKCTVALEKLPFTKTKKRH
ncbi:uncharacterized protein LOC121367221 [Gigantopelta aegis]|uniref:uncharacterized protein LOC121367221 n=1 Tax=Gigantopelta aegis TaxID=1735272 RepID=UPI001B88DAA2|nr:uncharacterized protein LOC121367221 [Gigantopelta aegis]